MQAPQQSPSAARKHIQGPGPAERHCREDPELPIQPVTANARPSHSPELDFAAACGLAHDAANLLGALGLYCDMLARPGVLRPEHAHYAAELHHLADRSSGLMRGLIERLPSAQASNLSAPVPLADPAAVLRNLSPLLSAIAAPAASVSVTVPPSLPGARFPAEALERILVNLVRNAAQAIERSQAQAQTLSQTHHQASAVPEGTIRIALTSQAGSLHLTVEDDGPGITLLDAAAFLAPSPLPSGTRRGLGHRIISELVAATGGTLTVRVRPGRGTRFTVRWPADAGSPCTPASLGPTGSPEV